MSQARPNARSKARQRALQALYQWQMTGQSLAEIERQFADGGMAEDMDMKGVDGAYFHELLHGIPSLIDQLDGQVGPFLDRPLEQVDPVERVIVRIGTYELMQRPEVPYRVAINEAVELAKLFGAEQGHKFINGILDKVAQRVRSDEVAAKRRPAR